MQIELILILARTGKKFDSVGIAGQTFSCAFAFYFRKPKPFRKIMKRKGRYFRQAEWKIRRNRRRENLKTEKATLLDGNCCWMITGSQSQEIILTHRNPVAQLDFYVKKVKSHKCSRF